MFSIKFAFWTDPYILLLWLVISHGPYPHCGWLKPPCLEPPLPDLPAWARPLQALLHKGSAKRTCQVGRVQVDAHKLSLQQIMYVYHIQIMCVHAYHVCICGHKIIHIYIYISVYMSVYDSICMSMYVYIYIHIYICVCMCVLYIYVCVCVQCTHASAAHKPTPWYFNSATVYSPHRDLAVVAQRLRVRRSPGSWSATKRHLPCARQGASTKHNGHL